MPRSKRRAEPLDIQHPYPESDDATYTVERAWILKTQAGTRCAFVRAPVIFESVAHERVRRQDVQHMAMSRAVSMWTSRWGRFDWDVAQFLVTHDTLGMSVELRVDSP